MNLVKEFRGLFIETAEAVADESYGLIRTHRHYSGRGMFGELCFGLTLDNDVRESELGARLMRKAIAVSDQPGGPKNFPDDLITTLERSCRDSMGLGKIIYFPEISDPVSEIQEDFV